MFISTCAEIIKFYRCDWGVALSDIFIKSPKLLEHTFMI